MSPKMAVAAARMVRSNLLRVTGSMSSLHDETVDVSWFGLHHGWICSALTCGLCMTDDSGNGNTSNNAAGRTPATLIRQGPGQRQCIDHWIDHHVLSEPDHFRRPHILPQPHEPRPSVLLGGIQVGRISTRPCQSVQQCEAQAAYSLACLQSGSSIVAGCTYSASPPSMPIPPICVYGLKPTVAPRMTSLGAALLGTPNKPSQCSD